MTATASYDQATNILTVAADGLPNPVGYGTFPNDNNPNSVTEQDFDHDFFYRGGTFGISRTFDSDAWIQDGFIRSITLSTNDNGLFGTDNEIRVGDHIMFTFSDGIKRKFVYKGTSFTSIEDECWLASDDRLDLIMRTQESGTTGTYQYYDQRNARLETPLGMIGIAANGVAIFNPSAGGGGQPPLGFNWNAHFDPDIVNFGPDDCGGHPEQSGQYHYHDSHFLDCWRANSSMAGYNDYYGSTQYNGNNIRHPDGHSKIIGIAFDGFPIYGPYGYNNPWDSLSGVTNMTSSWGIKDNEAPGRPEYGNDSDNPPAGALMQDWEYVEGSGSLDYHNGRFCITPEFQNGTFAYFLSTDASDVDVPTFPYLMGLTPRETLDTTFTNETVIPDTGGGGGGGGTPPAPPTLQYTLQPQSATVNVGETATFTVAAQILPENGPISYQWYRSTDGGFAFAAITGATGTSYAVTGLAYMTGYKYRCRIRGPVPQNNAENSPLDSNSVTLTVTGSGGGSGDTANRFDSTSSTFDSTSQTFDGT